MEAMSDMLPLVDDFDEGVLSQVIDKLKHIGHLSQEY